MNEMPHDTTFTLGGGLCAAPYFCLHMHLKAAFLPEL